MHHSLFTDKPSSLSRLRLAKQIQLMYTNATLQYTDLTLQYTYSYQVLLTQTWRVPVQLNNYRCQPFTFVQWGGSLRTFLILCSSLLFFASSGLSLDYDTLSIVLERKALTLPVTLASIVLLPEAPCSGAADVPVPRRVCSVASGLEGA